MNRHDPILHAGEREERFAREALHCAKDTDELSAAWWCECDGFEGEARERLQDEYNLRLRQLGVSLE